MKLFNTRETIKAQDVYLVIGSILVSALLLMIPTGFENAGENQNAYRTPATILEVDNSLVKVIGPVVEGVQQVVIKVNRGPFAGEELETSNILIGKKELDKFFVPGDTALVVLDLNSDGSSVVHANVIDHYRTDKSILLVTVFFVCLLLVAGWIGFKAIVSFVFTGIILLKLLLPSFLWGFNPIVVAFGVVTLLTAVIIFLVGGVSRKGLTAFIGAFAGITATMLLALGCVKWFNLNGANSPFLESLLYAGFGHIDLPSIFIAGIFVASSGAVMDLAMDIAASMHEVKENHPEIIRRDLVISGLTVGRHAVGTMTTTLLLAYSGGYTGMLMTFLARGVPFENVLNMVYVSSELVHTFVGSFGLVLVAPLTAIAGGLILSGSPKSIPVPMEANLGLEEIS
ncbi:MAG: YibE/F family protein [Sphaerochaeta sp.]